MAWEPTVEIVCFHATICIMMLLAAILLNTLVVGIVSSIVYGISYLVGFAFGIWHLTWLQSFAVGVVIWLLEAIRK